MTILSSIPSALSSISRCNPVPRVKALTRNISSNSTVSLITWDLYFNEPLAHVEINSASHEIMASDSGYQFSERLN
jgi:hypothetical protein